MTFAQDCTPLMNMIAMLQRLASVAGAVIEATARPDLEDFLRTRSPGEVITGRLSVRTSSEITLVSILGQCDL